MSDAIVKAIAKVASTDNGEGPGEFEVVLSTPTRDRDGEEVKSEEWDDLPEHVTFDHDHGMSVASTVGSGRPFLDSDGNLRVAGTYASTELAQTVRTLVKEGHIRTTSVAFLRRKSRDSEGRTVVRRELLNGAFVAVPANPEAIVLTSKSAAAAVEATTTEQAAKRAAFEAITKAVAGSFEERQEAVQKAISDSYDSYDYETGYVFAALVATTDADAIWRLYASDKTLRGTTWRASYDVDAAFTVTLGEAVQVRITEVATEVSPPEGETKSVTTDPPEPESTEQSSSAPDPAAKAARSGTDDDQTAALDRARALANARAQSLTVL